MQLIGNGCSSERGAVPVSATTTRLAMSPRMPHPFQADALAVQFADPLARRPRPVIRRTPPDRKRDDARAIRTT